VQKKICFKYAVVVTGIFALLVLVTTYIACTSIISSSTCNIFSVR